MGAFSFLANNGLALDHIVVIASHSYEEICSLPPPPNLSSPFILLLSVIQLHS